MLRILAVFIGLEDVTTIEKAMKIRSTCHTIYFP